jgi:probable HAF family extracellular repeat protein
MNSSGQIAGTASTVTGEQHAFLWSRDKMTDLGTLSSSGPRHSTAYAISSNGYVTGASNSGGFNHAFLARNGRITDVGVIPGCFQSNGYGVNSRGEVVGDCSLQGSSSPLPYAAFLYSAGIIYDLNKITNAPKSFTDRVSLVTATAISDSGYILASGYNSATGGVQLYLLKRLQ